LSKPTFNAFTTKYEGRVLRIVTDVKVTSAFDPDKTDGKSVPRHACKALWDTGASGSVISPGVAKVLKLQPVGVANVTHAGGTSQCSTYLVNLELPNGVGIIGVQTSEFHGQDGFDVIVGMDIISLGDFALTHQDGKTCASFRIPSVEQIDYVADAKAPERAALTPGRNSPCPCGKKQRNGEPMKYKNCCGKGK